MTTDDLVNKYGFLLTFNDLADLLGRSPESLRYSLNNNSKIYADLNKARKKIGRRVYFRAEQVAEFVASD